MVFLGTGRLWRWWFGWRRRGNRWSKQKAAIVIVFSVNQLQVSTLQTGWRAPNTSDLIVKKSCAVNYTKWVLNCIYSRNKWGSWTPLWHVIYELKGDNCVNILSSLRSLHRPKINKHNILTSDNVKSIWLMYKSLNLNKSEWRDSNSYKWKRFLIQMKYIYIHTSKKFLSVEKAPFKAYFSVHN